VENAVTCLMEWISETENLASTNILYRTLEMVKINIISVNLSKYVVCVSSVELDEKIGSSLGIFHQIWHCLYAAK
jgi:hypothetical protein